MSESLLRRVLLALAVLALAGGLGLALSAPAARPSWLSPELFWTAGTLPVVLLLAGSIVRDLMIGRFGVDAIALVSMSAALLLDQSLAAVIVAIMYSGGSVLEDFARGRAERNLSLLADRSPRTAHRRTGSRLETIPAAQVRVGDELVVKAGELVPADGVLLDGEAALDEAAVTGEPLPALRRAGDPLRSGTVNAGDVLRMRATATADMSTYAGIVRMVAAAQTAKAPFIRMADRFALFLLPVTLLVAGGAWLASGNVVRALAVLVVATPCPLILAAPVAFLGGISRAARQGVLMKGGAALEALAKVEIAIFDKTGTLTHGGAELIEQDIAPGRSGEEVLALLASLEQASHHVLTDSILAVARARGVPLDEPHAVAEQRGAGLEGTVRGARVRVGSRSYVVGRKVTPLWLEPGERRYAGQPVLRVYVAIDGRLAGVFTFGDAIRADARETVETLRRQGLRRFVILTGDDGHASRRVAERLGVDELVADATPAQKLAVVADEMRRGPVMMVGDGINDAPALAAASVGIAMTARGVSASSEAADVVILKTRLGLISEAVSIARRTRGIALQSIVAGLVLSALGMAAAAFGYIDPIAGAFIQEAIDVAVIFNALRAISGPEDRPAVGMAPVPGVDLRAELTRVKASVPPQA
ncbi:MAG: heavy metal translocating P-type ATPase [Rhizobiales bacterium]|nr:heavy metal translocating P-type ATPase [Hyphomicrobiales bacterium]